ncbi:MAG: PadR family transcriptional regulator [Gemmatimonadota bacterium]|jgi:DNA-binding PadR family transcriptional regulator
MTETPLTWNQILVLSALETGARYGLEVIQRTDLSSGTVYPVLRQLEARGMVEGSWESEGKAHAEGRPARRYYAATREGRTSLATARERVRERQRALGLLPGTGGP